MKLKKLSIALGVLMLSSVVLTSCNDDKKEAEKMRLETERVDMENAQKAEQEQMNVKAQEDAMKKDAEEKSIAGIAMKNEDLSTLVTALTAADLATMLSEPGEYTVFAPSNHAFEKLPQKQREALLMPENKEMLVGVLQYHVIPGKISPEQLADAIKNNNGSYKVKTVKGDELTFSMSGDQYVIKDGSGKKGQVILGNQEASNGIVYIIDTVLMASK